VKHQSDSGDKGRRSYASTAMRATAHPTREIILRALEEKPRSTVELEELTKESRYNLYHHLATLEQLSLVGHRISEGRTKEFFLLQTGKPDVAYLLLDAKNPEERDILKEILQVLDRHMAGKIPSISKIQRGKLLFFYPWSSET
jgi:hypothetical protein